GTGESGVAKSLIAGKAAGCAKSFAFAIKAIAAINELGLTPAKFFYNGRANVLFSTVSPFIKQQLCISGNVGSAGKKACVSGNSAHIIGTLIVHLCLHELMAVDGIAL